MPDLSTSRPPPSLPPIPLPIWRVERGREGNGSMHMWTEMGTTSPAIHCLRQQLQLASWKSRSRTCTQSEHNHTESLLPEERFCGLWELLLRSGWATRRLLVPKPHCSSSVSCTKGAACRNPTAKQRSLVELPLQATRDLHGAVGSPVPLLAIAWKHNRRALHEKVIQHNGVGTACPRGARGIGVPQDPLPTDGNMGESGPPVLWTARNLAPQNGRACLPELP